MAKQPMTDNSGGSRFPDGFRILQGTQEYITYIEHSSIRVWPSDVAGFFPTHTHSAIEVIMPHGGMSIYHLPNETYHVRPGEILIVPSGCAHSLTESQDTKRYLLLFEPNPLNNLRDMPSISAMMLKPVYLREDSELRPEVGALLQQVVDCYTRREPMWNTQCYSYLLQMYALLGRRYLLLTEPRHYAAGHRVDSEIMNSAMTYINEHYMDDISLEDVAVFTGFSKYYFSRVFKQFSTVSFSDYLTQKRLNVAIDLLVRTKRSVGDIAKASGFGSVATFNRIFREQKHCTPTQFRAIYGSEMGRGNGESIF